MVALDGSHVHCMTGSGCSLHVQHGVHNVGVHAAQIVAMELRLAHRGLPADSVDVAQECLHVLLSKVLFVDRLQLAPDARKLVQLVHVVSVIARLGGCVAVCVHWYTSVFARSRVYLCVHGCEV